MTPTQPPEHQSGTDSAGQIEATTLIALAAADDHKVTARMLETFREDGLMPRPVRLPNRGRTPVWAYPADSAQQLTDLMRWREYTTKRDTLRVLLWLSGHQITTTDVADAVIRWLDDSRNQLSDAIQVRATELGLDSTTLEGRQAAIDSLASDAAARKGRNTVLPRSRRVPPAKRTATIAMLLSTALGAPRTGSDDEAKQHEHTLGLDLGRQEVFETSGWLTGPASDLYAACENINLDSLRAAASTATEQDWEAARPVVDGLFRLLPPFVALMRAMTGTDNPAGWGPLASIADEPDLAMLLTAAVVRLMQIDPDGPNEVAQALRDTVPSAEAFESALDLTTSQLDHNLKKIPVEKNDAARRLLAAYADGNLTPAPRRKPSRPNRSRRA